MTNQPQPQDVCDELVVMRRSHLKALTVALGDLNDSASSDGCEEPLFVGDQSHLKASMQALHQLGEGKPLLESIRRIDAEDEDLAPYLIVVPPEVPLEQAKQQVLAAVRSASEANDLRAEFQQGVMAAGLGIEPGIEDLGIGCWDAHGEPVLTRERG